MLFVEFRFFIFFAIVLTIYWLLPTNNQRKWLLLFASYIFYGIWDWRFAIMLAAISSADWYFALKIRDARVRSKTGWESPRTFVSLSLAMNLIVLGFFKYFNFFADSTVSLANLLGAHLDTVTLRIILPVGVSFFTFQALSYTIDVYREDIEPVTSLRDYLMCSGFFPQLVAGPIVRPKYFVPQMESKRFISQPEIKRYLLLFLIGYIKKTCIADNISPFVDHVFQSPHDYTQFASITAVWLYATQIFCDFSGYSDMAISVAGLLGYRLALNFDAPYLATSIQDFWRRWHISLSTWIRDYIYISLGGRNSNRWLTYRNLMLTMLAGGLWHGAAWTFVLWGGSHGAAQVTRQEYRRIFSPKSTCSFVCRLFNWFITLYFVTACWILFRAPDFATARLLLARYLLVSNGGHQTLPVWLAFLPLGLLIAQYVVRRFAVGERILLLPASLFAAFYGCMVAIAISMEPLGYRPFIYFQF